MKTKLILYTAVGALLWQSAAEAGSRSGGTGTGAVTIPADTLSSGGGTATGGSGATAVVVFSSLGGVVGTVKAASGSPVVKQGFVPQILPATLSGFDLWASQNIPAGKDAAFAGDGNGDGIPNGVAYVFGTTRVSPTGKGKIPIPPAIPADVDVYLDRSIDLTTWLLARVSWVNGAAPTFVNGNFSIVAGEVVDTANPPGGDLFYRYRVVRR